jgi:hypothetical protein
VEAPYRAEETPISSSGVRLTESAPVPAPRRKAEGSESSSYRLTPYQARLDVEMDDTAVSKVRDPSVSILLGPNGERPVRAPTRLMRVDAVVSVVIGTALGALVVVAIVAAARAFFH